MKTLKQIREEYNNKFTTQVEAPEELMLEGSKDSKGIVHAVPSIREMPSLLIFRRVSYRLYPSKQVVALYYSKLLDKYLSIPFGPGGNLNLSEAVITDTIEEQGSSATRYTERPTYEDWKQTLSDVGKSMPGYQDKEASKEAFKKGDYLGAAGHQAKAIGKAVATGAAVAGAVGLGALSLRSGVGRNLLRKGARFLSKKTTDSKSDNKDNKPSDDSLTIHRGELIRDKPGAKVSSSWSKAADSNPVTKSKMQQAALKENKISDIRKMVKEGIETKDLIINERSITLNTSMAKRILEVYDSVNSKNKKIVESMLNEDLESFKKLLNFSIKA